jgi:hypothetical protein
LTLLSPFNVIVSSSLPVLLRFKVNERLKVQHKHHLETYWPIQGFATLIEVMCFFSVHPALFTLVVCIKTTIMTTVWLGKREDGSFVSVSLSDLNIAKLV